MESFNFNITFDQEISQLFKQNNCSDFHSASEFVQNLPYRRNLNKDNLATVFIDECGTCSTKHALLKTLTEENNQSDFKLILGIFRMNGVNTPKIKSVLETYNLDYIPEAHNYLKFKNQILDFTKRNSSKNDFITDLLDEIEIQPHQINQFKIEFHRSYLKKWLIENPQIPYSLEKIWDIRELCIAHLS
ncbi:hypothetical protein [Epilithonimonas xixisoli]|uniref:Uncharacterized protein n=1 Tax=Epilithonimonas xixisoli TaxID=1476462 RepID=A0A4R8I545_9FLAO|nr:hypothetical protein [Epilithonimonas xixisoli]TDX82846.1 hypothetical protein B0I22_2882 [Epilithonimonas xixisoli]